MIPKKPAVGLDPRVDTGFRKRSCSTKRLERDDDSKKKSSRSGSENSAGIVYLQLRYSFVTFSIGMKRAAMAVCGRSPRIAL
jgi:hypothetical protein